MLTLTGCHCLSALCPTNILSQNPHSGLNNLTFPSLSLDAGLAIAVPWVGSFFFCKIFYVFFVLFWLFRFEGLVTIFFDISLFVLNVRLAAPGWGHLGAPWGSLACSHLAWHDWKYRLALTSTISQGDKNRISVHFDLRPDNQFDHITSSNEQIAGAWESSNPRSPFDNP